MWPSRSDGPASTPIRGLMGAFTSPTLDRRDRAHTRPAGVFAIGVQPCSSPPSGLLDLPLDRLECAVHALTQLDVVSLDSAEREGRDDPTEQARSATAQIAAQRQQGAALVR